MLGERISAGRAVSIAAGLLGVLVVIRPWQGQGAVPIGPAMVGVLGVVAWALAMISIRRMGQAGERFDSVICDPPAFAKSKKDQAAGLRGYQRMARLAAALVAPGGFLFAASCSHHAPVDLFAAAIAEGLHRARREGRILATTGAGPDHPVHPHLPESAYLKAQVVQLF